MQNIEQLPILGNYSCLNRSWLHPLSAQFPHTRGQARNKRLCQVGNITLPLSKVELEWKDIQAVVEISQLRPAIFPKIAIRSRNDPYVEFY